MLAMTLLVRDEVDIIATTIAFHLACGVDRMIVTDNGSVDGTLDILRDFERDGAITLIREPGRDFAQDAWVTRMALMARDRFGADWIINGDADEFWLAPGLDLRSALPTDPAVTGLRCHVREMIAGYDDDETGPWWERLDARIANPGRARLPENPIEQPLPDVFYYLPSVFKEIPRARGLVRVGMGNHTTEHDEPPNIETGRIRLYHYPVRSRAHFARMIENERSRAAGPRAPDDMTSWHKRRWVRLAEASIDHALADALPSRAQLEHDLATGKAIRDLRPQRAFRKLGLIG